MSSIQQVDRKINYDATFLLHCIHSPMCMIFFHGLIHVLIFNPVVVTCTGPACRLIQVAMCAESSECKNLHHDDGVGYDKGPGINVNYAWLYRTLTSCLHAVAMQQCPCLSRLVQQCIAFFHDCGILISKMRLNK